MATTADRGGAGLVLAAAVLWGTTGTARALAPAGTSPLSVGAVRIAVGGAALVVMARLRGELRRGGTWPLGTVVAGAVAVAGYQLAFFSAVARTGVAVGTMVAIGSAPPLAGLLAWVTRAEPPGRRWYGATALAVAGGGLLAGAALLLVPVAVLAPLGWLATPRGALVALHLGLLATAAAYALFAAGLRRVTVATAATMSLAEPLTAAVLGVALLGERLTAAGLAGAALLVAGLLLLAGAPTPATPRRPRRRQGT